MKQKVELDLNVIDRSKDLIVCWPLSIKRRKPFYGWFGYDRWQLGTIGPHRVFKLRFFIGPWMISTGYPK